MGKEDLILKKVGTKNPFNVPDGYFDNFTKELMNQLPEKTFKKGIDKRDARWYTNKAAQKRALIRAEA